MKAAIVESPGRLVVREIPKPVIGGYDVLCPDFGIIGAHRHGGCAEYVAVPAVNVVPKPASLAWEVAAR